MSKETRSCLQVQVLTDNFIRQERHDDALFQTFLIVFIGLLVLLILFSTVRLIIRHIYMPFPIIKPKKGFFDWLSPIIFYSDDELYKTHGMDSLMFVLLQKSIIKCTVVFLIYGLFILMPIDATSSNKNSPYGSLNRITGLSIFSISNINIDSEQLNFIAHIISVILNSFTAYYVFFNTYKKYINYRRKSRMEDNCENYAVLIKGISRVYSEEDIYETFNRIFPNRVLFVHRLRKIQDLIDYQKKRIKFIAELERVIYEAEEKGKRIKIRRAEPKYKALKYFTLCRDKVDAIEYYKSKIDKYERKINKEVSKLESSYHALVVFTDQVAAMECDGLQVEINGYIMKPELAPQPNDIQWKNFRFTPLQRYIRFIIILIVTIFATIFFTIPVVFAQGIANWQQLVNIPIFSFLKNIEGRNEVVLNLLAGIIPPLIVVIFFELMEAIIRFFVWIESPLTKSSSEEKFFMKMFYVQLLNVFLITLFAGSIISRLDSLVECVFLTPPLNLIQLIGEAISNQVNYFISYIVLSIITVNISLLQPHQLLKFLASKIFFCFRTCQYKTPRDKNGFMDSLWFKIGFKTSQLCIHFIIGITFSSITGMMPPFALLVNVVNYISSRYFILYINNRKYEGYGRLWPKSFNNIFIGVIIYQIIMAGVFLMKNFIPGVIICLLLVVATIIYLNIVNKKFYRKAKNPIVFEKTTKSENKVDETRLKNAYLNPHTRIKDDKYYKEIRNSKYYKDNNYNNVESDDEDGLSLEEIP